MGYLKYVQKLYQKPKDSLGPVYKERLIKLRRAPTVHRVENPTRPDKARQYGYKAKKGFFVVSVKINRGGKKRHHLMSGRKPVKSHSQLLLSKNHQTIADERASRDFPNAEVLGSYWIAEDGLHVWYEVVLADRNQVSTYKGYEWLTNTRGRAFRGITSSSRRSRGLRHKGKGAEKLRPSLNAHKGLGN